MTQYRGTIHIDDVRDGQGALSFVASPSTIFVDTKADGAIDDSCLTNATASVGVLMGIKTFPIKDISVDCPQGITATVSKDENRAEVKITSIDKNTSGQITVFLTVVVDGKEVPYIGFVDVITTAHKVTAEIIKDNKRISQSVTDLATSANGHQRQTEAALNTLNGAISGKVSQTEYNKDKQEQTKRETEIRQTIDGITLSVRNKGNLLKGTGFRNKNTLPELTGDAVLSDSDYYGSHGTIHAPMSTESTVRNTGMRYLVERNSLEGGRTYTFSISVLVKEVASLSNIFIQTAYLKADKTSVSIKQDSWNSGFVAGSWRRVSSTFTPDFSQAPECKYVELTCALASTGEVWFAEPQLEIGEVATPWTPNVYDADDNLQATALELANRKIVATTDNFVVRNNEGVETAAVDKDGNLTAGSLVTAGNGMYSSIKGGMWETGLRTSNGGHSIDSPAFRMAVDSEGFAVLQYIRNGRVVGVIDEAFFGGKSVGDTFVPTTMKPLGASLPQQVDGGIFQANDVTFYRFQCGYIGGSPAIYNYTRTATPPSFDNKMFKDGNVNESYLSNVANFAPDGYYTSDKFFHIWRDGDGEDIAIRVIKIESGVTTVTNEVYRRAGDVYVHKQTVIQE